MYNSFTIPADIRKQKKIEIGEIYILSPELVDLGHRLSERHSYNVK